MSERTGIVSTHINARDFAKRLSRSGARGKSVLRSRAERLDDAIQQAWRQQLPIRVIVVDGEEGDIDDPRSGASKVKYRLLDPLPWSVASYATDGDCTLTRGALPGKSRDQFSVEPEPERRIDTVAVFIRDRIIRENCLQRARGLCEYCANPGFTMDDGEVYLETHLVVPLSEGGPDTESNVAALCANHHREAHHGAGAAEIRDFLLKKLAVFASKRRPHA